MMVLEELQQYILELLHDKHHTLAVHRLVYPHEY